MARYNATVQLQLNTNGAIGNIVSDYGTSENAAVSAYHSAGASIAASQLVAGAIIHVSFDEDGNGSFRGEIVRGNGEITPQE